MNPNIEIIIEEEAMIIEYKIKIKEEKKDTKEEMVPITKYIIIY
jgi:hypothetical protein